MAIYDIFSKRQKRLRGDLPDVYVYDDIPQAMRVQIIHIWHDALGTVDLFRYDQVEAAYSFIVNGLCREYGLFRLPGTEEHYDRNYILELAQFFLDVQEFDKAMDVVERSFQAIDLFSRDWEYLRRHNASEVADSAIDELNRRFKEHGVGFQYTNGEIIRIDSELIHSEVVKPALRLLNNTNYLGPQQEFLKAHEHYRHGNTKEALNECLKAFESMMKSICDRRGWKYSGHATAKNLLEACFTNGLVPTFWQQSFASLRSLLESSVPTGRNKLSGHGQGAATTEIPIYLVAYMLHMTASALVFLGEADAELP